MEPPAPQPVAVAKSRVRAATRAAWRSLDRAAVSAAVTARVVELPCVRRASCVAAYVGRPDEIDTTALLALLHERGVTVLLPALAADGSLQWRVDVSAAARQRGLRGTTEPPTTAPARELAAADVVVVPGVAFDASGGRLGRGGGSFDRVLATLPRAVRRVALAPDEAIVDAVPVEAHDAPVDVVVTPSRVITVSS